MKKLQEKNRTDSCAEHRLEADELRETAARYHALFDRNPYPMCVYDAETSEILEVNRAALTLRGLNKDEFIQLQIKDIQPAGHTTGIEAGSSDLELDYGDRKA